MSKYIYTTIGQLRNVGEDMIFGEEPLDNEEEVRLVAVAKTKNGETLFQADVKDSYGTWDSHMDDDITTGYEKEEFFDIETDEHFESYCGYGMLLTDDQIEGL